MSNCTPLLEPPHKLSNISREPKRQEWYWLWKPNQDMKKTLLGEETIFRQKSWPNTWLGKSISVLLHDQASRDSPWIRSAKITHPNNTTSPTPRAQGKKYQKQAERVYRIPVSRHCTLGRIGKNTPMKPQELWLPEHDQQSVKSSCHANMDNGSTVSTTGDELRSSMTAERRRLLAF